LPLLPRICPMDILSQIFAERREAVKTARRSLPLDALREAAAGRVHHSLAGRLAEPGLHIIAEMKKASPSAGLLRPEYDPRGIAGQYLRSGACAISVLTEPAHFLGSLDDLRAVRVVVDIPILRKDFMCDVYQVYEAAAAGADVILLIVAGLDESLAGELHAAAREVGLDVLVESHTEDELAAALRLDGAILGVNSRCLKTLTTDLAVARRLAAMIPPGRVAVAESGIHTRDEIVNLQGHGYRGVLIGEALMSEGDAGAKLRELLGRPA